MSTLSVRALALFLGAFALLNLVGGMLAAGFDVNLWWIDLRLLPEWMARPILAAGAGFLLALALRPEMGRARKWATAAVLALLFAVAAVNGIAFYVLLGRGAIHSGFPVAFSLVVAGALAVVLRSVLARPEPNPVSRPFLRVALALGLCAGLLPFGQIMCFGKTDYRRPADAIVVFGCRTYADGRPSDALADRVSTACRLYHDGLARTIVFSGGPGDGPVHETEAMQALALRLGVPAEAIVLDREGVNTRATVENTSALFARLGLHRVLAVSHFYHLPRIKMAYQRAGIEVYTVPATESYLLTQMPWLLAREVVALWAYYLRT